MTASSNIGGAPFGVLAAKVAGSALGRKTRALLERGDSPRSGEKVWRNSYYEGQIEHRIWRPFGIGRQAGTKRGGRRLAALTLRFAKALEKRSRLERQKVTPGVRNGVLGDIGIRVLEAMLDLVDFASGRLEPAIATIAESAGCSYAAAHEALCRLRKNGFLQWIRRSRPTENKGEVGPQVEQITNAYALLIPDGVKELAQRLGGNAPPPDDAVHRRRADADEVAAMLAGQTIEAGHLDFWTGDRLLGETVAALARALDRQERESSKKRETGGSY